MTSPFIVMLGTDFSAPGGITAVIRTYAERGFFARFPVRFLPTYRRNSMFDKALTAFVALSRFLAWLLTGQVSAVHAHSAARASFWRKSLFLLVGKLAGAKAIFHLHDGTFPSYYEGRGKVVRALIRFVLSSMDRVVVLTPSWAEYIRQIEFRARVCVIPNPVQPLSVERTPKRGQIVFLGRLWKEKGIFDLIDAAESVVKRFPDVRFICAGDGDIAALRKLVASRGLAGNFDFPGWVEGACKDRLLAECEVFVLPSYFEGLPIGVLEAMVNGIPVVATSVGGIHEALGEDAGILVPAGAVTALADALNHLLGDDALRLRMGQAGRTRGLREFSCDVVFQKLGELYAELDLLPTEQTGKALG
ncbi:MAG: glycosyltransferase family 4 protein [Pseudomonadota bacterium]